MAEPFLAEIRIYSFNFPPKGWAACDGQLLPINQNQALFSLLGTTYGGDGRVNFALPNLKGRTPIHRGSGHTLGEAGGSTSTTVTIQQMPQHIHFLNGTNVDQNRSAIPTGNLLGPANNLYAAPAQLTPMDPTSVTTVGGSQPHNNMMPSSVLNFCIALQGIFPSQT